MSNALYPLYKKSLLEGANNVSLTTETVKVSLVDKEEILFSPSDQYYSDLNDLGIIATDTLTSTAVDVNGVFSANDASFTSVTGDTLEALLLWIDTGDANTSHLVAYLDTNVTGLPFTPDGSNTSITWNASGIFQL